MLGLLGPCAPVDWGWRAGVGLRCQKVGTNGGICEYVRETLNDRWRRHATSCSGHFLSEMEEC